MGFAENIGCYPLDYDHPAFGSPFLHLVVSNALRNPDEKGDIGEVCLHMTEALLAYAGQQLDTDDPVLLGDRNEGRVANAIGRYFRQRDMRPDIGARMDLYRGAIRAIDAGEPLTKPQDDARKEFLSVLDEFPRWYHTTPVHRWEPNDPFSREL